MSRLLLLAMLCVFTSKAAAQERLTESTAPRVIMETPFGGAVFVYKVKGELVDMSGTPVSVEKATLHRISADRNQEVGFVDLGVLGLKKINIRKGLVTLDGTNQGLPQGTKGTIYRVDRSTEYEKEIVALSSQLRQDFANYYSDKYPRQFTGGGNFGSAKRGGITDIINCYKNLQSPVNDYGHLSGGCCDRYGFPRGQVNNNWQNSGTSQNPYKQHLWTKEATSIVSSYEGLFSETKEEDSKMSPMSDRPPLLIF